MLKTKGDSGGLRVHFCLEAVLLITPILKVRWAGSIPTRGSWFKSYSRWLVQVLLKVVGSIPTQGGWFKSYSRWLVQVLLKAFGSIPTQGGWFNSYSRGLVQFLP